MNRGTTRVCERITITAYSTFVYTDAKKLHLKGRKKEKEKKLVTADRMQYFRYEINLMEQSYDCRMSVNRLSADIYG